MGRECNRIRKDVYQLTSRDYLEEIDHDDNVFRCAMEDCAFKTVDGLIWAIGHTYFTDMNDFDNSDIIESYNYSYFSGLIYQTLRKHSIV